MSLRNDFYKSSRVFFKSVFSEKKDEKLLFDVLHDQEPIVYGLYKSAICLAKNKGLEPLAITGFRKRGINQQFVRNIGVAYSGTLMELGFSFVFNFKNILKITLGIKSKLDILNISLYDIKIGEYIYDSILRSEGMHEVSTISKNVRARVALELTYFLFFNSLFNKYDIKCVVCSDNVYRYGFLTELAKKNSIELITPIDLNGFCLSKFTSESDYFDHNRRARINDIQNLDQNLCESYLKEYFSKRTQAEMEQHDVMKAYSNDKRILDKNELIKEYDLNPDLPIVVIMSHIFCDAPHAYPGTIYDDYFDWFKGSLLSLLMNKNINLLVKEHPSASLYNEGGLIERILASFQIKNTLIKSDVHNLTILENVDIVVTCGGTIGQEFSYYGKPVVLAAKPPYSGYGFTHDFDDKERYEEFLSNKVQLLEPIEDSKRDILSRVIYYDLVKLDNYQDNLELGGQRFYLGRDFCYSSFYKNIIKSNKIELTEQVVYKKLKRFDDLMTKHI